jgi:ABC-type transport system involved in multi-copper enzyme maturation permease subunit
MKIVATIAGNVVKDTFRKKIFFVVFLFAIGLLALSPLLPSFDLGIKAQFLKDVSISLTSVFGALLAVILSVGQIPGEADKKTIYNILSKPVSRLQYYIGKYLGILACLAIILAVMAAEILILIYWRTSTFAPVILQGVFAVFLETAVIAAFCLALSTFVSVPVNVFATVLFYLLCHVKTSFLHQKLIEGVKGFARVFSWSFYYLIPNLDNFNLSEAVGYGHGVGFAYMARITGYAVLFAVILLVLGYLVLRRRDF